MGNATTRSTPRELLEGFGADVMRYLQELDSATERLSLHNEGHLASVPGWYLTHRRVKVGYDAVYGGAALSIRPDDSLSEDLLDECVEISSLADYDRVTGGGWSMGGSLQGIAREGFMLMGDMTLVPKNESLAPAIHDPSLIGFGALASLGDTFSGATARTDAVNAWTAARTGLSGSGSVMLELQKIFDTFRALIKRKAFLERRIHRFLNSHKAVLLPEHRNGYFEVVFRLGGEFKKADFILEREEGVPAWLVELETTSAPVLRQNGDLTAESNHACQQIADWVRFIDQNSAENAKPPFQFLLGNKQRLVIIGRGLDQRARLLETRYTDTLIWTYDMLWDQAKRRWANAINAQRALVGLPRIALFGVPA
jgi:hypothetical protein